MPDVESEPSEEDLMVAYARGDGGAFDRLFARLAPRVHGFFRRSFADPALADDLFQATFLRVHRCRAAYEPGRPVRSWLFTIAARVRLDELRRRYRLPASATEEDLARIESERRVVETSGGLIDGADRGTAVRAALLRLPESQRVVVCLHFYEGMTFAEISRTLGSSEGAVKLRAFRAYKQLRGFLEKIRETGSET